MYSVRINEELSRVLLITDSFSQIMQARTSDFHIIIHRYNNTEFLHLT